MNNDNPRSRAWRRHQNRRPSHHAGGRDKDDHKPAKKWDLLYSRSVKIKRARQLGIEYPKSREYAARAEWPE